MPQHRTVRIQVLPILRLAVFTLLWGIVNEQSLASECNTATEKPEIRAVQFYEDKAGSIVSAAKLRLSRALLAPLRAHLKRLETLTLSDEECALSLLAGWAESNAFIGPGKSFEERRHRIRVSTALNIAAIRIKRAGLSVDTPIVEWLSELNGLVAEDFRLKHAKGYYPTNLLVWAAVSAGLHLYVEDNERTRRYINQVWEASIMSITSSGYSKRELTRGKRSLYYHYYHHSALTFLTYLRQRFDLSASPEQLTALSLLSKRVTLGLCTPETFVRDAPVRLPEQFVPNGLNFDVAAIFGDDVYKIKMRSCGFFPRQLRDEFFNGDITTLPYLLRQ